MREPVKTRMATGMHKLMKIYRVKGERESIYEPMHESLHKPMRKRKSASVPSFEFFFTSTEKTLLSQKLISYLPTKSCGFKYNAEYML